MTNQPKLDKKKVEQINRLENMKLKDREQEIAEAKKKKTRKIIVNQDMKDIQDVTERRRKAEEQRGEIKSKVRKRIEEILEMEIDKVRKPREQVTVTKLPQFDEMSSVNQLLGTNTPEQNNTIDHDEFVVPGEEEEEIPEDRKSAKSRGSSTRSKEKLKE